MKSLRVMLAAAAAFFFPCVFLGQTYTTVTATNLPLSDGQLCFTGTDSQDNEISYTTADGTLVSSAVCGTVSSGSLSGSLQVVNTATATPSGLSYRLTLVNGKSIALTIRNVAVTGSTWDFGSYLLPATGIALGFGTPSLLCDAGAQFISTDQQPSNWVCAVSGTTTIWQSYPSQGYCPANSAYLAPTDGSPFCVAYQSSGQGAPTGACTQNGLYFQQDIGNAFLWGCVNGVWQQLKSGEGTVKSIGIAVSPQMTVSGSPVTDSGTISIALNATGSGTRVVTADNNGQNGDCVSWTGTGDVTDAGGPCVVYGTEPANTAFMAPDGVDGLPSFRHITVHDLPYSYSGSTTELATVSGTLVSGSMVAVGANGNLTDATSSTYFPGYLDASQVEGLSPSATVDTTNASNITSGTLDAARLPASTFACPTGEVLSSFTLNDNTHPVCSTAGGTITVGNYSFIPFYSDTPSGATIKADTVFHTDGNGGLVARSLQLDTGTLTVSAKGGNTQSCAYFDQAGNLQGTGQNCGVNGTVTSAGLETTNNDIFSVSNSPITSSGVITLALNNQLQQTFLAGPVGDASLETTGTPGFRALAFSDLPAGPEPDPEGDTDIGSYVLAGPLSKSITSAPFGYYAPRWRHLVPRDFGYTTPNLVLAGPASGTNSGAASFRSLVTNDLPTQIFKSTPTQCAADQAATGVDVNGNANGCFTVLGGSVLSVGLSLPDLFTVSGSPVTTSGTLTATLASQSKNTIFAAPSGAAGTPLFRSMTAADLPSSFNAPTATKLATAPTQCSGGLFSVGVDAYGNAQCAEAGVVTDVGLALPDIFTVTGSPVTTSGTLTATFASETKNTFFAAPNGANGTPLFRSIVAADLPSVLFATAPTGCGTGNYATGIDQQGNAICAGAGSVTSVGLALPDIFTVTNSPVTTSGNLTASFSSQTKNLVFASPSTGSGTPAFRSLVTEDMPADFTPSSWNLYAGTSHNCAVPSESSSLPFTAYYCGRDLALNYMLSGIGFQIVPDDAKSGGVNDSAIGFRFYNGAGSSSQTLTSAIYAHDVQQTGGSNIDNIEFYTAGLALTGTVPTTGGFVSPAAGVLGWQSGSSSISSLTGSPDTGFSRCGAACIAAGNGTAGDASATLEVGMLDFGSASGTIGTSGTALAVSPVSGVHFQVNGDMTVTGATILNSSLTVAATSNLNATNFGANATLLALGAATSLQNYGSTSLNLKGSYWDGTQSDDALWTIQNLVGSGTTPSQTLSFVASGSSGSATVQMPGLTLTSLSSNNGCLTVTAGVVSSTGVACGSGSGGGSGSGTVTSFSAGGLDPLFTASVVTPTTTPALTFTLQNAPAHSFFGNTASGSATPSFAAITAADLPVLTSSNLPSDVAYTDVANKFAAAQTFASDATFSGNVTVAGLTSGRCVQASTGGLLTVTSTACQQGTVTSVALSVPGQMTVTGSPITSSGTIALGLNTLGTGTKIATGSTVGTTGHSVIWTSSGDLGDGGALGTVSSIGIATSGILTASNTPITSSGNITIGYSGTSGGIPYFSSASAMASSGVLAAHSVVLGGGAGAAPTAITPGTSGYCLMSNGTSSDPSYQACAGVSSVGLSLPSIFTVSTSTVTSSGTLTATLASETANTIFAAPSGAAGAPTFRSMVAADMPTLVQNAIASSSANLVWATPAAATGTPSLRSLVTADMPTVLFKTTPTVCSAGYSMGIDTKGNSECYDPPYLTSQYSPTGMTTVGYKLLTGDLNKDGYTDIVMPVYSSSTGYGVQTYISDGNGGFTPGPATYSSTYSSGIISYNMADLNGDGYADFVTGSYDTTVAVKAYCVWLNQGSTNPGGFTITCTATSIASTQRPYLADLNGDGNIDMILPAYNSNAVAIYQGNGDGTFTLKNTYTSNFSAPTIVVAGDFNKDGYMDFAVNNYTGSSVTIYLGSSTAFAYTYSSTVTVGANPIGITLGDVTGDGYPDLVVVSNSTAIAYLLTNNKSGGFTATSAATGLSVAVGQNGYYCHPTLVDVNGDGFLDMVIGNTGGTNTNIYLNNGSGTFSLYKSIYTGTYVIGTAALKTGANDYLPSIAAYTYSGFSGLTVYRPLNTGTNVQQYPLAWVSTTTAQSITGTKTFMPQQVFNNGLAIKNDNNGDIWNVSSSAPTVGNGTFSTRTAYTACSNDNPVKVADLNGDGYPDIVTACSSANVVAVSLNNGDGTFGATTTYTAPTPFGLVLKDLNGDGYPDIVVGTSSSSYSTLSVFLNQGNGTFGASTTYTATVAPGAIDVGDMNGDGYLDIMVMSYASTTQNVVSLLGKGDGTFNSPTISTNKYGAVPYIRLADVNADGKLDVLTTSYYSGYTYVGVGLGNGDGTVGALTYYSIGGYSYQIDVGDLNGDGYVDVVAATENANVAVLLNNAAGGFATYTAYTTGSSTYGVALGDVNGDGKLDIISANHISGSGTLSVLLNSGTGTFGSAVSTLTAGSYPFNVAVGDFNKDGILDIVDTDSGSGTLSVFRGSGTTSTTNLLSFSHITGQTYAAVQVPALALPSGSYTGIASAATLTAARTYSFPDQSGTVGLVLTGTSASIGGSALSAGTCATGTATISGATTSMVASTSPVADPGAGVNWQAWVSASGTVTVRVCNTTSAAVTPTASAYNVRVIQ